MVENAKGLKWHNFIIYFGLWVSGIGALISGLLQLTVMNEFQLFPTWVTASYGIALIVLGCYCIYVRFQLAGFIKGAPQKFLHTILAGAIIRLAYIVIAQLSVGSSFGEMIPGVSGELIAGVIGTGIAYWIHKTYYDNRKELFNRVIQ